MGGGRVRYSDVGESNKKRDGGGGGGGGGDVTSFTYTDEFNVGGTDIERRARSDSRLL